MSATVAAMCLVLPIVTAAASAAPPDSNPSPAAPIASAPQAPDSPAAAPAPAAATFTISGTVTGAAGVTVSVTGGGGAARTAAADAKGAYSITVATGGTYMVAPLPMPSYVFSPPSMIVRVSGADVSGVDFSSAPSPRYSISGTVSTSAGPPVPNVVLNLEPAIAQPVKTDSSGHYAFSAVPAGQYRVKPGLDKYVFFPAKLAVTLDADQPNLDFGANQTQEPTCTIQGAIRGAVSGGVPVSLTGPNNNPTDQTNEQGTFRVSNLPCGEYTVKPTLRGYLFNPASASAKIDRNNPLADLTFVATATARCTPPSATFRWAGSHAAYMMTSATFEKEAPKGTPTGFRIYGKDDVWVVRGNGSGEYLHCSTTDTGGCKEQLFPVDFEGATVPGSPIKTDADLLKSGGRVSVEFEGLQDCSGKVRVVDAVAMEQHHLAVDLGESFTLDAKGSFSSNVELSVNAYSRWTGWFSGEVDLRMTRLAPVQDQSGTQPAPESQNFLRTGGNTLDGSVRTLINFDGDGSVFTTAHAQPWLSLVLGGGLRSLLSNQQDVDVRWRLLSGVRLGVLGYNAGGPAESFTDTRGAVELGVADDTFWADSRKGRLYVLGQLEIPSIGSKFVRFLGRIAMDRPLSGIGPSEVRISVLSTLNPAELGKLLGFGSK